MPNYTATLINDVGSRFQYVAIGQRDEDVKKFGVYNVDNLKDSPIYLISLNGSPSAREEHLLSLLQPENKP